MEIKQYKEGDEQSICDLFKSAFNKEMNIDYWNWRYRDNPTGIKMISLMWDGDKLAGHYALSPVHVNVNNEKLLSGLSMTTMTHPDYRGLGIFPTLAEHLYKEQQELNELALVWGFPNNNSHYIFSKVLKWKDVEQIPTFSLNIQNFKRSGDSVSVKTLNGFTADHFEVAELTKNNLFEIDKSKAYLEWRYLKNPTAEYQIFGLENNGKSYYSIAKAFKSFDVEDKFEIDILELSFPNDYKSLVELISALIQHYSGLDVVKINMWATLSKKNHLLLEKIGFTNQAPITYLGFRSLKKDLKDADILNNWHYQMGDSDVY